MLYITPLVLIYLITENLYLLTAFFQLTLTLPSAAFNHKSDLSVLFCVVFEV